MAISLDEAFENVVEYENDADSSATSNFVDEGENPNNSTPNQSNSIVTSNRVWTSKFQLPIRIQLPPLLQFQLSLNLLFRSNFQLHSNIQLISI